MINLIMLCGQGSTGKSTYGQKIHNEVLSKDKFSIFARYDNIADEYILSHNYERDNDVILNNYFKYLNESINKKPDYLIIDFNNMTRYIRNQLLNSIKTDFSEIDFQCVYLYPKSSDTIIERQLFRQNYEPMPEKYIELYKRYYDHAEMPTVEEFKEFNFKTVKTWIIDNSEDITDLDVSYLF